MNVATLIVLVVLGQQVEPPIDPAALVEKLGSASYAEREATRSLENLGSKALPALRQSLKSRDPEVRTRARGLINKIEGNLLTQASLVRLDFKDAPLDEVVKSLSKEAGFEVGLNRMGFAPEGRSLGVRRVTLVEPQPVPFWNAIDRLCEAGQLTRQYQAVNMPGQVRPQPGVFLAYQPEPLTRPGYNHGPFHLDVVSLTYTSRILFNAFDRQMPVAMRSMMQRAGGVPNPAGVPPPGEASPAAVPGSGQTKNARPSPARHVQFMVQLQIVPEPRMAISRTANFQLLEAVDELGQSLLPSARNEERSPVQMGMIGSSGMVGMVPVLSAQLHRPETPGKLIKKLRGTIEVSVSTARSNPLVISLEGSVGKTFQNDERRVVVDSIDHDPMMRQEVIVLTVDDLNDLFPVEPVNGSGLAPAAG